MTDARAPSSPATSRPRSTRAARSSSPASSPLIPAHASSSSPKRVRFRVTPTVRYFKSTQSASWAGDARAESDGDDNNAEHEGEDPRFRALRGHRRRRRLDPAWFRLRPSESPQPPRGPELMAKIAADARGAMEAAVREARDPAATSAGWRRRSSALDPSAVSKASSSTYTPASSTSTTTTPSTATRRLRTQSMERQHHDTLQVVHVTRLEIPMTELDWVLRSTAHDELTAALLACLSERLDASMLLEALEMPLEAIDDERGFTPEPEDHEALTVAEIRLPPRSLTQASHWIQAARNTGMAKNSSASGTSPMRGAADRLLVVDHRRHHRRRGIGAGADDAKAIIEHARILQTLDLTTAAAEHQDHVLLGDVNVGYLLDADPTTAMATVAVFASRRRRRRMGLGARIVEAASDAVWHRASKCDLPAVLSELVQRRRLGFQSLAYADLVYGPEWPDASLLAEACPCCGGEFGLFRKRHFCHVCALWTCRRCLGDRAIETVAPGWVLDLGVCTGCTRRLNKCVFDYHAGPALPQDHVLVDDPQVANAAALVKHRLAHTCAELVRSVNGGVDAMAIVMDAIIDELSPPDRHEAAFQNVPVLLGPTTALSDKILQDLSDCIQIPILPKGSCRLSSEHARRRYELLFENGKVVPASPLLIDEKERINHVDRLGYHDLHAIPSLDAFCAVAAREFGCRYASISIVRPDSVRFIGQSGFVDRESHRDETICGYCLLSASPLVTLDAARDLRMREMTWVRRQNVRFYVGLPLLSPDGSFLAAVFALSDSRARSRMSQSQYSLLVAMGRVATLLLHQAPATCRSAPIA